MSLTPLLPSVQATETGTGASSTTPTTGSLSIPALNSLPGARAKLVLDFNGDAASRWDFGGGSYDVPATPAYSRDTDTSFFSHTDIDAIRNIWRRVAEMYAPFNLNVTTLDDGDLTNQRTAKVVIGGRGDWLGQTAGGVGTYGGFYNSASNKVYVFSARNSDPGTIGVAAAHEAGHGFGLHHQSVYDEYGGKEYEYNPGTNLASPVMGFNASSLRKLWWRGTNSYGNQQNDSDVLAGSTNGFGYRGNDHGLAAAMSQNGSQFTASGLIHQRSDTDGFVFATTADTVGIRVSVPAVGATLDAKFEIRTNVATGYRVIASADTATLGEKLSNLSLAAGSYRILVSGKHAAGGAGDSLGNYTVTALTARPGGPYTVTPGGTITLAADGPGSLTYAWDLDGDEVFGESGEVGRTPTFRATGLAAGTTKTVNLRVSDGVVSSVAHTTVKVGAPTTPIAEPWHESDVGAVGIAGSTETAGGEITVRGAGANIFGANDGFHFAYQSLSGDGQVVARIDSFAAANSWAKAGVMIRSGAGAGAQYAALLITPSNGVVFQYRAQDSGLTTRVSRVATVPSWLKVIRAGNTFRSYISANGSSWTLVGSATVAMGSSTLAGLAVTSRDTTQTASAVFSGISITAAPPATSTAASSVRSALADGYVRDGTYSSTNFGTSARLETKSSGGGFNRISYLKFDLQNLSTINSAVLELHGRTDVAGDVTVNAFAAGSNWTETNLTWNSRPLLGSPLGRMVVSGNTLRRYTLDLTAYLKAERAAGRTVATIALKADYTPTAFAWFNSGETATGPHLAIA